GYCYLLTSSGDEEALQRLKMLETLSDGFEISRYDLSLRGPGDLLGTRQSGVPGFVLGNVITDEKMMEAARSDAAYALQHLEDEEYACLKPIIEQDVKKSAYFD
ncbi:MAG: ATP-dependent DNA helicase RecG, partial [Merdibacter sp.]|nr:ATP-dependent DNA helicase RecG [Merdibacter sp.]